MTLCQPCPGSGAHARRPHARPWSFVALVLVLSATPAAAAPYIWDQDDDHVDDRIETVNALGYQFAFEGADSLLRARIAVKRFAGTLIYDVFVVYDHPPTTADIESLHVRGMTVSHRYESVWAVRSRATFVQLASAAALAGVARIEAVPVLYASTREGGAAVGVRDPSGRVSSTWLDRGGSDGSGIVIAFLDTGINDAAEDEYPGHESLIGRCLGGAEFSGVDSLLDTPRDGSVNPVDRGELAGGHGTHVASIALGSGGETGLVVGVAPGARFVDVKVLGDAGSGTGVAEGLDWCIHNRARDWGASGYEGIDVISGSISSPDPSDGNDVVARLAARAAELGIVVVCSMGNDGETGHVPSPAGGDGVIAVAAYDDQRTAAGEDDRYAAFDNRGPRASDGDAETSDELKPDVLAPGVAVLGADGDLSGDGRQYLRRSGTSMAAPFVSGAVALLRAQHPELSPAAIGELLRSTAWRSLLDVPAGPGGSDPRWHPARGYGRLDLGALWAELETPIQTQIARLEISTRLPDQVEIALFTQREQGVTGFTLQRAPDQGGVPGTFTAVQTLPATGDGELDAANRQRYSWAYAVPPDDYGAGGWFRIAYVEDAIPRVTPARRVTLPAGPSVATLELTIVHSALDHDVSAEVVVGEGSEAFAGGPVAFPVPGTGHAVANEWVTGTSTLGNVAWTFRIEIPVGAADAFVPPSAEHPWRLRVDEGGFLNRGGRVTDFRLIWHTTNEDIVFVGGPVPRQTLEGQTVEVSVPNALADVGPARGPAAWLAGPNPVRAGEQVTFSASGARGSVRIFDVTGRQVAAVPWVGTEAQARAVWSTRDSRGRVLPAGMYFAESGGRRGRFVVVGR